MVHRGVVIYVKKQLGAHQFTPENGLDNVAESMWVEIPLKDGEKLVVASVYRSPNSSADDNTRLYQSFVGLCQNRTHVLIAGDCNHPEVD